MPVNWSDVQKSIFPIKDYEDLCQRLHESFSYPFVCAAFNKTMPQLAQYVQLSLGGDPRGRYTEYASMLHGIFTALHTAGVADLLDLVGRVDTRKKMESMYVQSAIPAPEIAAALKYLVYWFIPTGKYLSGLVRDDPQVIEACKALRLSGIRTNLDLLQQGITPAGRRALAESSGLPEAVVSDLVNRADFSRLPWASKATISNIIGAGYGSLARLRNANPEQLYADFFRYGKSIGKNLKLGNEIENSYRIAQIVPVLVKEL